MTEALIYAKSGYTRTVLHSSIYYASGTTVTGLEVRGSSWNNTADNITSIVIGASTTNGLGVGTSIELWKKVNKI